MTKVWDGPTPYDEHLQRVIRQGHSSPALETGQQGFKAAMNSPTVRAMYEAAKTTLDDKSDKDTCCGCHYPQLAKARDAYEAGLKETADDHQ